MNARSPESPTPEPTTDAKPPAAPARVPRVGRARRLWRWSRKWTLRAILALFVVVCLASVAYAIYRPFAFRAREKELTAARAELDASDPGWRFEDIEAAHNATIPPPETNSFTLLTKFPEHPERPPEERAKIDPIRLHLLLHDLPKLYQTNELPNEDVQNFTRILAVDLRTEHPVVASLARSPVGGVPMHRGTDRYGGWEPQAALYTAGMELELVSLSAAARADHRAGLVYALAALNAGRAVGAMPRMVAQQARRAGSIRSTRILSRMLAWGESRVDTVEMQRELLAEADSDFLKATLRGERAVLQLVPDEMTIREEFNFISPLTPKPDERLSFQNRTVIFVARPYRRSRLALATREITRAIALCDLPLHERWKALKALDAEHERGEPTVFHAVWDYGVRIPAWAVAKGDCHTRATLRTAAVALACERFRIANKRWPNTLDELPPTMLTAIPADPFDGKPLRYAKHEDGVHVYSIGADGRERGEKPWETGISFRLWNPELRGVPAPNEEARDP